MNVTGGVDCIQSDRPTPTMEAMLQSLISAREVLINENDKLERLRDRLYGGQPESGSKEMDNPHPMGVIATSEFVLSNIEDQLYRLCNHIEVLENLA